jgi:hypothetical protein
MRLHLKSTLPDIAEVVYHPDGDIFQVWLRKPGPSVNEYVTDGIYRVLDLETRDLLGFEIYGFSHFVHDKPELAEVAETFDALFKFPSYRRVSMEPDPAGAALVRSMVLEYA